MVQQRGRKTPKLTAAMGEYFDRVTSSYCPECGKKSSLVDGMHRLRMHEDGDRVLFSCPDCGEFSVEWKDGRWYVAGSDIPYIMNAETNSATLLHRFDPSSFADAGEAAKQHVRLVCENILDYHYVGDDRTAESLAKDAFAEAVSALGAGAEDPDGVFFSCFDLYFTMAANGRFSKEDVESAVGSVVSVTGTYGKIYLVGLLSMCAESLRVVGGVPDASFFDLYRRLSDSEPEPVEGSGPFSVCTYLEGLALVAVTLGRPEDALDFVTRAADLWKRTFEDNVPSRDDLERMLLFVQMLSDTIEDGLFEDLLGPILEVADRCASLSPYMYDTILMMRYEHRLENGLDPYDRSEDLDMLAGKYSEPSNVFEASIAVKALAHRALEAEDTDDVFADMSSALDLIISSKLRDSEFRDLVMDVALRYYDLAEDDKKVQRSVVMRLKKIGITKDMLKAWKKHSAKH